MNRKLFLILSVVLLAIAASATDSALYGVNSNAGVNGVYGRPNTKSVDPYMRNPQPTPSRPSAPPATPGGK